MRNNKSIMTVEEVVEALKDNRISLENDGTLEQLNFILKKAFPKDSEAEGSRRYYQHSPYFYMNKEIREQFIKDHKNLINEAFNWD